MKKNGAAIPLLLCISLCITFITSAPSQAQQPTKTTVKQQVVAAKKMLKALRVTRPVDYVYDRTGDFGDAWLDVDGNSCDTRNDILQRDLTNISFNDSCEIRSGRLRDPYTGKTINFTRGVGTSLAVQIDHVIPLHLAWQLGATRWSVGKRVAFANDPANLLAVDGPTNGSKSDSGPDEWLPPRASYRCTYVIRFIRVAYLYGVRITSGMKTSMTSVLNSCTVIYGRPALLSPLSRSLWSRAAGLAG